MARAGFHSAHVPATYADLPSAGIAGLAERAYATLIAWQARVTERNHLRELDERLLKDMGVTRIDAQREAAKPFWRA